MPAKRRANGARSHPSAIDRVTRTTVTKTRANGKHKDGNYDLRARLKAEGKENGTKMRAYGGGAADLREKLGSDLRRTIEAGREQKWPRGQVVGEEDARMSDDLRRRLTHRSTSASNGSREDLRSKLIGRGSRGASKRPVGGRRGDVNVSRLLRSLDLDRYVDAFAREEIDYDALKQMREKDFNKLGVPFGPMVKITRALIAMRDRR